MALIEGWHAQSMDLLFNQPPNFLSMEFLQWATTNDLALICYLLYLVRELAISSIPGIRIQWAAAIWLNQCLIHMHTWLNAFKLIPSSHYKPRIRPIINRVDNYRQLVHHHIVQTITLVSLFMAFLLSWASVMCSFFSSLHFCWTSTSFITTTAFEYMLIVVITTSNF